MIDAHPGGDDQPSETGDEGECEKCEVAGFDTIEVVLLGDSEPSEICWWCHKELVRKEVNGVKRFDYEREKEVGLTPDIGVDGGMPEPEELSKERRERFGIELEDSEDSEDSDE